MADHSEGALGTFWTVAILFVFAAVFGGGGSKYGMANLIVQLAALTALSFHRRAFFEFWATSPAGLRVLIAASIMLPLIYLVPLPVNLWQSLPGRELMTESFALIGEAQWASASVDPIRTLLALTALIAPLALLTIGWNMAQDRLIMVGWIAVGLGLANFLIGIPQVLSAGQSGLLYPENPMPGVLFGTFANRNSTGLLLVGCVALAALLPPPPRLGRSASAIQIVTCMLLIVAIILTRSRTALVLTLVPIGAVMLRVALAHAGTRTLRGQGESRKAWFALVPAALIAGALGFFLATGPGRVNDVLERFDDSDDARAYIWEDAAYSADRYWPIGSGMGTFDDVFQIDESLENMTLRTAGRAHNDYLEVAIEAGLPGLTLIAGWLILLGWLIWRARKSRGRWIAWSGGVILLTIALQSITDYPLRNLTMLTFASYALLILLRFGSPEHSSSRQEVLP
ncbi:O-antigen ligase family protein [Qipengyuania sp. ASV99]|uniref:O-antigen ligase family protein n=1 Tax=Qipengyuania sp. ASV99 TaxID=3399681 RepID=UPI003A4C6C65